MTIHYKRHWLPKLARRTMKIREQQYNIIMGPRRIKNQSHKNHEDIAKLTQVVFNLKAEMGTMRKAMTKACISFNKPPNKHKQMEQSVNGKQKGKFAGKTKKKNQTDPW